jgi:hypothetical protein
VDKEKKMNSNITDIGAPAASDGLDMQQRAMGSAGQIAALLDQPYLGDAQQIAMGSASQSLLTATRREVGSYVSGTASSEQPGGYISTEQARPLVTNSYVNAVAPEAGAYVTTSA